ncbi:hypothetical protein F5Y14DRAFT_70868 [Nemania sp. NC0429]|nr:hypothetical protein F5Y14DRAFT_70868 [Nemania sp. NC0429]
MVLSLSPSLSLSLLLPLPHLIDPSTTWTTDTITTDRALNPDFTRAPRSQTSRTALGMLCGSCTYHMGFPRHQVHL